MADLPNTAPAPAPDAAAAAAPAAVEDSSASSQEGAAPATAAAAAASPYADFTLPEGVKFNDAVLGKFKSTAAELKLDQAGAQKFVDIGSEMAKAIGEGQAEALKAAVADWTTAAKNDKEIGGEKFDENVALANRALATFGSPELIDFFAKSGISQNPEVIRAFVRVGKAVSEDTLVAGGRKPNGLDPSDPRRIYNHPTSFAR